MKPRGGGRDAKNAPTIIIRRAAEEDHGHHGGAWKIAYADFVTAMMAFFLLLWLVNATTEQQRTGIADYFAPSNLISRSTSGAGQMFGGRTMASDGRMASDAPLSVRTQRANNLPSDEEPETAAQAHLFHREAPNLPEDAELGGRERAGATTASRAPVRRQGTEPIPDTPAEDRAPTAEAAERADQRDQDRGVLRRAAEELRAAITADTRLRDVGRQLLIEEVPDGLRIQLVDSEGQAVFATGQAAPNERGRNLLLRVAPVVARLPYPIEITGYTDAAPFRGGADGRTNWDLSAERANATRRLLVEAGVVERRIRGVVGRADTDPLRPNQPFDAANRRVSILVRVEDPPRPADGARPAGATR